MRIFKLFFFLCLSLISYAQSPGNALNFTSSGDVVNTTLPAMFNDIANQDFTIEMWVNPSAGATSRLFFAQSSSSIFTSILLNSSNVPYFYVYDGATNSINSNGTLPMGQWSHLACVWIASSNTVNIYINGVLDLGTGGGTSTTSSNGVMTLGAKADGTQSFIGSMDEVRIWDIAKSECQIQADMNAEFSSLPTNVVAYYRLNEGTAGGTNTGVTTAIDVSGNFNGILTGFALTGSTSNWVTSGAIINTLDPSFAGINITDSQEACESYTWIDGNTYNVSNNTATHLVPGPNCDTLFTLDLTILESSTFTDVQEACNSYTWMDGITYTSSNNSATYTLTNTAGCDSIITLDLTINTVDVNVIDNSPSLTAVANGAQYQWVNCDNNYEAISGATDQTFEAPVNGNFAVIVIQNGCIDTSACYNVNNVSLSEIDLSSIVKVSPNPTSSQLNVELGAVRSKISIELLNALGQVVLNQHYDNSNSIEISLDQPTGIYLLKINADGRQVLLRVIKE